MKRRYWLLLPLFLAAPLTMAQSIFDGTWKIDVSTAKLPDKPDDFLLKDGMYDCKTCVPPVRVKADGQDHRVTGSHTSIR